MINIWKFIEKALVNASTRIPVVEFVQPFFGKDSSNKFYSPPKLHNIFQILSCKFTYIGQTWSVSGSSVRKRSWSRAQGSQWSNLFHRFLGMGTSHRWHSTKRGPQQKAKQADRKNQKTTTHDTTITQDFHVNSRSAHSSSSKPSSETTRLYIKAASFYIKVARFYIKVARFYIKVARLQNKVARLHNKAARLQNKVARLQNKVAWLYTRLKNFFQRNLSKFGVF